MAFSAHDHQHTLRSHALLPVLPAFVRSHLRGLRVPRVLPPLVPRRLCEPRPHVRSELVDIMPLLPEVLVDDDVVVLHHLVRSHKGMNDNLHSSAPPRLPERSPPAPPQFSSLALFPFPSLPFASGSARTEQKSWETTSNIIESCLFFTVYYNRNKYDICLKCLKSIGLIFSKYYRLF